MVAIGPITSWNTGDGDVTTWTASSASRRLMRYAERDPMPPSTQQAGHLRRAFDGAAAGRELPRLLVLAWDMPGVCDIAAMTTAITTHVRRHDTYHSAFEVENDTIVRRTIDAEHIDFVPTSFGRMTADQVRDHALTTTPGTLSWDCFTFGIVAKPDHFSVYASVDHLHFDLTSAGLIFLDIHLAYQDLAKGRPVTLPEAGRYGDYTARQRAVIDDTTLESPHIRDWVAFAEEADGDWPSFPLPLGDSSRDNRGCFINVEMLDAEQTEAFDTVCREAGARFSGGVMAAAALAEHEITGTDTFQGFTPLDTRTQADTATAGWFASIFPVSVPIGDGDFAAMARAAQKSFDERKRLADVPFERVLELASADQLGITMPTQAPMMVSYADIRRFPVAELWEQTGFGVYGDNLSHGNINLWITRHAGGIDVTISFPDNPEARQSAHRYVATLGKVFADVARITADWIDEIAHHANSVATPAAFESPRR